MKISVNDTKIFFDIDNVTTDPRRVSNQKPTIIAIHGGLGFDHRYLKPGLDAMRGLARIVYVDLRGQGQSDRPSFATCSLEQMADDIAKIIGALDIGKSFIFGHSAGGFIAMLLAARYPQLVKGIIVSGTAATLDRSLFAGASDPKLADRAPPDVVSIAERYYTSTITPETVRDFFGDVGPYYAGPKFMDSVSRLLALSTVDVPMLKHFRESIVPSYDIREQLSAIRCPALVLVGSFDWVCPPSASQDIATRIGNAEYVEFSDSGHFLFSEEPERFHLVMNFFLRNHFRSQTDF